MAANYFYFYFLKKKRKKKTIPTTSLPKSIEQTYGGEGIYFHFYFLKKN
jgi:hypothetical protein